MTFDNLVCKELHRTGRADQSPRQCRAGDSLTCKEAFHRHDERQKLPTERESNTNAIDLQGHKLAGTLGVGLR